MGKLKFVLIVTCGSILAFSFNVKYTGIQEPWKAPAAADTLVSPYLIEPLTLPQGQEIYTIYCASCHGHQGMSDGTATNNLKVKPLKFQDKKVSSQTNGAIFWKIREGRGEMPSFRDVLSDEQKWQMVEYIRDISKPYEEQLNPLKARH
ncbi:cytochrome c [Daejeonella sp.]|uniref:c-type cytochrome n=1 Tax=Daejeonella sp. TaxID=2805397 RepID=UPI0030BACDA3